MRHVVVSYERRLMYDQAVEEEASAEVQQDVGREQGDKPDLVPGRNCHSERHREWDNEDLAHDRGHAEKILEDLKERLRLEGPETSPAHVVAQNDEFIEGQAGH